MTDSPFRIGVVLLNYNGMDDTLGCLASLRATRPGPDALVIVDNASRDDSLPRLARWCAEHGAAYREVGGDEVHTAPPPAPGEILLVRSARNLGFAGGNNLALPLLDRAGSTHVLFLNNDTEVAPDFFAAWKDALRRRPDAAVMGCTIHTFDEPRGVWYTGGHWVHPRAVIVHHHDPLPGDEPVETEFVTGCAMLVSKETLALLGPLPEIYFPLYYEDTEYSWRARERGLPVLVAPRPLVYHKVGMVFGPPSHSTNVSYWHARHRFWLVRRNLRGGLFAATMAYLVVTKIGRAAAELLRLRPRFAWAYLRSVVDGVTAKV